VKDVIDMLPQGETRERFTQYVAKNVDHKQLNQKAKAVLSKHFTAAELRFMVREVGGERRRRRRRREEDLSVIKWGGGGGNVGHPIQLASTHPPNPLLLLLLLLSSSHRPTMRTTH